FLPPSIVVTHYVPPRHLHSFPTRRSSDLTSAWRGDAASAVPTRRSARSMSAAVESLICSSTRPTSVSASMACASTESGSSASARSEEHTSELQSRFDLVCRLLLEKKNDQG